MYVKQD